MSCQAACGSRALRLSARLAPPAIEMPGVPGCGAGIGVVDQRPSIDTGSRLVNSAMFHGPLM